MAFADRFIVRNSLYVTTAMAACVAAYMVVFWESMPVTQGIIGLYYILIAAHEWEELKYPGGFVELAISLTDMPMRDMRIPKFALLCITVYMLLIPFCFPQFHWLVIGALVLGIIEPLAHIVAGRGEPQDEDILSRHGHLAPVHAPARCVHHLARRRREALRVVLVARRRGPAPHTPVRHAAVHRGEDDGHELRGVHA